jgi:uncharacterized protein YkwD
VLAWTAFLAGCSIDLRTTPLPTRVDGSTGITVAINPSLTPVPADSPAARAFAQQTVALVNAARRDAGLMPLLENTVLTQIAQNYSQRMATEGFYGHEDPQGQDVTDRINQSGYLAQMNAENIAGGQPDPATVVDGWLNSPGHRANIMNPDLAEIGAGYAYADSPPYYHYWTHVFATPDASVGRDRSLYPAQVIDEINKVRQAAGVAALTLDETLSGIALRHLEPLVGSDAFDAQIDAALQAASQAALPGYQQMVALSAAGPGTPEDVVVKWTENTEQSSLADAELTTAGVAYLFVEQDTYRHYWLLLMGG